MYILISIVLDRCCRAIRSKGEGWPLLRTYTYNHYNLKWSIVVEKTEDDDHECISPKNPERNANSGNEQAKKDRSPPSPPRPPVYDELLKIFHIVD